MSFAELESFVIIVVHIFKSRPTNYSTYIIQEFDGRFVMFEERKNIIYACYTSISAIIYTILQTDIYNYTTEEYFTNDSAVAKIER